MEGKRYRNRTTEIIKILAKDECRFAYGVQNLVALRSEKFEEGYSYHILTDGKVDMLNHLRWLMIGLKRCISQAGVSMRRTF